MNPKPEKPYVGNVVLTSDTWIGGKHHVAGTVVSVSAGDFVLLKEGNRCEVFDPDNEAHQACQAATLKVAEARKKQPAEPSDVSDGPSAAARAAAKNIETFARR